MSDAANFLTLPQAAAVSASLGRPLGPQALRRLCRIERMRCLKIGTGRRATYLVTEQALREALATAPRRGGYRGRRRPGPPDGTGGRA